MSKRSPPVFRDGMHYKEWKAAIEVWSEVNNEDLPVQASLVVLAVEHPKARSMLLKLHKEDRCSVEKIFKAMDKLYKNEVDPVGELFKKYRSFDRIERGENEEIHEYLNRYMTLYNELVTEHKLELPDPILSYKLFEGANMDNNTLRMIRMNCQGDLSLTNVVAKFNEAFDYISSEITASKKNNPITVKQEYHDPIDTLMMIGKSGKQLMCYICKGTDHLQKDCPHNKCIPIDKEEKYTGCSLDASKHEKSVLQQENEQRPQQSDSTNTWKNGLQQYEQQDLQSWQKTGWNNRSVEQRPYQYQYQDQQGWQKQGWNSQQRPNNGWYHGNQRYSHQNGNRQQNHYQNRQPNYNQRNWYQDNWSPRRGYNQRNQNFNWRQQGNSRDTDQQQQQNLNGSHSVYYQNTNVTSETEDSKEKNMIVFYGTGDVDMSPLVKECLNHALLDTGAGKTVCGETWLSVYTDSIKPKSIERVPSNVTFRFGDGDPVKSCEKVFLPVTMGTSDSVIESYVVTSEIPLLISRETMKQFNVVIDTCNDKVQIQGHDQVCGMTSSGQYLVPIIPKNIAGNVSSIVYQTAAEELQSTLTNSELAVKLHKVLAHASAEKICKLLKEAGKEDKELNKEITKVVNNCHVCKTIRRAPPKPKVCLPLSSAFNECVAMDIKFIEGNIVLHLIDTFTRLSTAAHLKNKAAPTVMEAIMEMWVSTFGRPKEIFSDNGKEFDNQQMHDLAAQMDINLKVTPVEAPYSNGICERHNAVIDTLTRRVNMDTKCGFKTALLWAVNAKNSLHNIYGFSPQQLVFGKNNALPSILETKNLATLNEHSASDIVANHMNALAATRKEFMKIERDTRLKRALKSRIPGFNNHALVQGDKVYYKRLKNKDFYGPGIVVAVVDHSVLIKHAGRLIRLHPSKVILQEKADEAMKEAVVDESSHKSSCVEDKEESAKSSSETNSDSEDENDYTSQPSSGTLFQNTENYTYLPKRIPVPEDIQIPQEEVTQDGLDLCNEDLKKRRNSKESISMNTQPEIDTSDVQTNEDMITPHARSVRFEPQLTTYLPTGGIHEEWTMDLDNLPQHWTSTPAPESIIQSEGSKELSLLQSDEELTNTPTSTRNFTIRKLRDVFPKLRKGDNVKVKECGKEMWKSVTLASRGGKISGKNQYHWNVVDKNFNQHGIFFDRLEDFKLIQSSPISQTTLAEQSSVFIQQQEKNTQCIFLQVPKDRYQETHVKQAMEKEVDSWKLNDAYVEVDDEGQKCLSSRWVVTEKVDKTNPAERVCKARLVVRGYEENLFKHNEDNLMTDSPTSEKRSQRVLLNVAASEQWVLQTLDIKSAFLKSSEIDRVLFIKPPREIKNKSKVWLLKKPVYGLKDASRCWYQTLTEELIKLGCEQLSLDKAVYRWQDESNYLGGLLLLHVDDMLYCGNSEFVQKVIDHIKEQFEVSSESSGTFAYVGIDIIQLGDRIKVNQNKYTKDMELPVFAKLDRVKKDLLSEKEVSQYRRLVGQMMWVVSQTRPDMIFPVICASMATKHTIGDMLNLIRIAQKMKNTEIELSMCCLGNIRKELVLYCFTDGRYGIVTEKQHSIGAHIIFLANGKECSVVSWHCGKIKSVVTSAMEAETTALMDGIRESIYIRNLISEMLTGHVEELNKVMQIGAYCDSQTLCSTIYSETQSPRLQLRRNIAWLRQVSTTEKVFITWTPGEMQMADALTREKSPTFEILYRALAGNLPKVSNPAIKQVLSGTL